MAYNTTYTKYNERPKSTLEYSKYRVRGQIKSFRDLEIYQKTTELASQIILLDLPQTLPQKKSIEQELNLLQETSKQIPVAIAESYGDKFTNRQLAYQKLELAMQKISQVISKLDLIIAMTNHSETKQTIIKIINQYQIQKRKTLNLKKAWVKTDEKYLNTDNQNDPIKNT